MPRRCIPMGHISPLFFSGISTLLARKLNQNGVVAITTNCICRLLASVNTIPPMSERSYHGIWVFLYHLWDSHQGFSLDKLAREQTGQSDARTFSILRSLISW